jgi:hypothetical protein
MPVLVVVAISFSVRRCDALHRDIIDLRGKTEMKGDVEPAHLLPEPKINDDTSIIVRAESEIEYDREFVVAHTIIWKLGYDIKKVLTRPTKTISLENV